MLNDRQQELDGIEKILYQVKDIIVDLNVEVEKQGEKLVIMSSNLKEAKKNMVAANVEMVEAKDYAGDANKNTLFMCICISVVVILLLMLVTAGKKEPVIEH